jgi:hypothetical protein
METDSFTETLSENELQVDEVTKIELTKNDINVKIINRRPHNTR